MATITEEYFTGGTGHAPTGTDSMPPLATVLRDMIDDFTELRDNMVGLMVALDAEGGLGGGYVAGYTPAALKSIKG
jgi:hypothetical protein